MDTYDGTGAPPYSPMMLLSLVIFAYINGVYSCRGIADVLKYDVCYMWICGGKQLSFMPSCPVGEALTTSSWLSSIMDDYRHPDAGSVLLAVKEVVEGQCKTSISIGVITSQASMVHRSKRRWYLHPSRSRHL